MAKNLTFSKKKYLLIFGDIIILYFSLWLTLAVRYFDLGITTWLKHLLPFSLVFFIWIIIFYIDDLYDLNYGRHHISLINRLLRGTIISGVMAVLLFYFAGERLFSIKPQRILLINLIITAGLLYFWRILFSYLVRNRQTAENILIIGNNPASQESIKNIMNNPALGFKIKGIIHLEEGQAPIPGFDNIYGVSRLKNVCEEKKIKTLITAVNPRDYPELLNSLFACLPLQMNYYDIATFSEKISGKIPVNTLEQMWFLENLTKVKSPLYQNSKRIFDIVTSTLVLILTLPFFPLIALLIKLNSPGPVFFKQVRVGENAKIFTVIKFRSMVVDAENQGAQWASKNDPRVTRLGKFIRKTRIDEIPQLINVIKGEMSLIGPRPERPEFVEQLQKEIPFYKERLLVKPGLTGWAQIEGPAYGGSKEESLEKLQYDLYYIKNQSLGLDLSIALKTIKTILTRRGQ